MFDRILVLSNAAVSLALAAFSVPASQPAFNPIGRCSSPGGSSAAPKVASIVGIVQSAYVKASNTAASDSFGHSIAVSGDTIVVGAPGEDSNAIGVNGVESDDSMSSAGAAYVFVRSEGVWTQQAYLKASNTDPFDTFGWSVSISGDTIVVGAPGERSNGGQGDNSLPGSGAAYVFVRSNGSWTQQAYLKASNVGAQDSFGTSVSVDGNTIVVGATSEDGPLNSLIQSGAAYAFERSGTTWREKAYLRASNADPVDSFGVSVSVSGGTIVVGAYLEDSNAIGVNGDGTDNSALGSGAAYVFAMSSGAWAQQAYLKPSNTNFSGFFGESVSVSADTIVIGAHLESSNSVGVNGNQNNAGAAGSGAAYVFVWDGSTWGQQAYLKASNTDGLDGFGTAVANSGDMIVVGAIGEDSPATGINGSQGNSGMSAYGAAYLFARNGTIWTQQAYIKASNPGLVDSFGGAVAISDHTLAVATTGEDSNATGIDGNQADNSASGAGAAYAFDVCSTPAAATSYGAGKLGSLGVPVLSSTNPPILNTTADLTLSGGLPGATPVLLFAGFIPSALPFDGGSLLVNPAFVVTLPALDGSGGFVLPVPLGTSTCGLHLYFQAMFFDPGASGHNHTAQTNGLAWTLGA